MQTLLVSLWCADKTGLVAAVTGRLFDLGANLGDTTFAVLGGGAEFTSVCDVPDHASPKDVEAELRALPEVGPKAKLNVEPLDVSPVHGATGRITHRITISGGDRPGLLARLSEVFVQFGANIVRLNSERIPDASGGRYVTRIGVAVPENVTERCLATIGNTAGELGLDCHWRASSK